jgi:hypothetical protein
MKIQAYKVIRSEKTGARFVRLANGLTIPAATAGMCAGPDRWLSQIQCPCVDCGNLFTLRELGETGERCEICASVGIEA